MYIDREKRSNILKNEQPDLIYRNHFFYFKYMLQYNSDADSWFMIKNDNNKFYFNGMGFEERTGASYSELENMYIKNAYENYLVNQQMDELLNK